MQKFAAILLLLFCSSPFISAQKARPGQLPKEKAGAVYPLKAHVSEVHIRADCPASLAGDPCKQLYADAIIDGKKFVLMGAEVSFPSYKRFNLLPGDYEARLLKDSHTAGDSGLRREYELVLPGKIVWQCTVTSISE